MKSFDRLRRSVTTTRAPHPPNSAGRAGPSKILRKALAHADPFLGGVAVRRIECLHRLVAFHDLEVDLQAAAPREFVFRVSEQRRANFLFPPIGMDSQGIDP